DHRRTADAGDLRRIVVVLDVAGAIGAAYGSVLRVQQLDQEGLGRVALEYGVVGDGNRDRLGGFARRESQRPRLGDIVAAGLGRTIGRRVIDAHGLLRLAVQANREGRRARTLVYPCTLDGQRGRSIVVEDGAGGSDAANRDLHGF